MIHSSILLRHFVVGQLRSYATHAYTVDKHNYSFTVEQTIDYRECSGDAYEDMGTMRLTRSKAIVVYGEMIIRYVLLDTIAKTNASKSAQ